MSERDACIMAACETALSHRDPRAVCIFELMAEILEAVPGTSPLDIQNALHWSAEIHRAEVDELWRWAKPTIPFKPRAPKP
jgi:hypothetical protein